jgi:hypothetical protein
MCVAILAGAGVPWNAAWGQIKPPAENSPLQRTKTKLKPPSAPRGPRPLDGLRATGGRKTPPRQPRLQPPTELARRAISGQNSLHEQVREDRDGEMTISLNDGNALVSGVFRLDGSRSQPQVYRNVIDAVREGRGPVSNQELQEIVAGDPTNLAAARQRYLAEGYDEVRISSREVVFVKTDNPAARVDVANMLDGRVSEGMYRGWVDNWERQFPDREWVYAGGVRRSCSNGSCSTAGPLDAFILRGGLAPERAMSEVERAEMTMDDEQLAVYALERGDFELAVTRFESYISQNPEEAAARRSLGVAYLNLRRVPDGVEAIAAAYRMEPALAGRPIDVELFEDATSGVYGLLQQVVPMAHRSRTEEASLVAVALMQAQGRTKEATRMLQRAAMKGLPESILREFAFAGLTVEKAGKPHAEK